MTALSCVLQSQAGKIAVDCADKASWVSDAIWAAVIAVLGSAITLALANWHSRRLQEQKLEADEREADRSRKAVLRKDVYLPAVAASTRVFGVLGEFSHPRADAAQLTKELGVLMGQLNGVIAVGSEATIQLLLDFLAIVGEAVTEIASKHLALAGIQARLDVIDGLSRKDGDYQDAMARWADEMQIRGGAGAREWGEISKRFERFVADGQARDRERAELERQQATALLDINLAMQRHCKVAFPIQPKLICSLRADMEIETDAVEVERMFAVQRGKAGKMMDDTMAAIQRALAEAGDRATAGAGSA